MTYASTYNIQSCMLYVPYDPYKHNSKTDFMFTFSSNLIAYML